MLKRLWKVIYDGLIGLNFYPTPSPDLHTVQTGRWATRLYLVLLIGSIVVLTFYSSLTYNTETVIVPHPSLKTFLALQSTNKQGLSCPCKQISILQSSLISFSPEFHQFCSSDFVSGYWFKFLVFIETPQMQMENNWRWGSLVKFRFLKSMCNLTASSVNDAVSAFGQARLVTAVALTPSVFDSEMAVLTRTMIDGTAASFSRALDLIIINKHYEQVLTAYKTNFQLGINGFFVGIYSMMYNNFTCNCAIMFTCTEQILLTINNTIVPVPGWYIGCYIIDSLLDSTLECYYDQVCIDSIYAAYQFLPWLSVQWNSSAPRPRPLNATRATMSRFPSNATVHDCISELLVDDWHVETNFEAYYEECQPIQCSYTERVRKNVISVVTTIIALLGGLTTALDIMVPNTVRFLRGPAPQFFRRLHARVSQWHRPVSPITTIAH